MDTELHFPIPGMQYLIKQGYLIKEVFSLFIITILYQKLKTIYVSLLFVESKLNAKENNGKNLSIIIRERYKENVIKRKIVNSQMRKN